MFPAWHLENKRQNKVRWDFGHDLVKAYVALEDERKVFSEVEFGTLKVANEVSNTCRPPTPALPSVERQISESWT